MSDVVYMGLTDPLCVFVSRTSVEDVPGGAQRVSAGADRPDLPLQRRHDRRAASGLHD